LTEKAPSERQPARILVVDDEEVVWEVIRNTLDQPGWYLYYAANGEKAIEMLLSEPFDLVIADKNLPGITGLDVIRQAKKRDPNMATLIITAYASRESAEEAMAIGVDDYLVKPFGVNELQRKAQEALDLRWRRVKQKISGPVEVARRLVVLCESHERVRRVIAQAIKELGHRLHEVDNVSEVLEALQKRRVDILICSLELLQQDSAQGCFLRSALLLAPEVLLIAIAAQRGLENAVEAAHHSARRVLYRNLIYDPVRIAQELEPILGKAKPS